MIEISRYDETQIINTNSSAFFKAVVSSDQSGERPVLDMAAWG